MGTENGLRHPVPLAGASACSAQRLPPGQKLRLPPPGQQKTDLSAAIPDGNRSQPGPGLGENPAQMDLSLLRWRHDRRQNPDSSKRFLRPSPSADSDHGRWCDVNLSAPVPGSSCIFGLRRPLTSNSGELSHITLLSVLSRQGDTEKNKSPRQSTYRRLDHQVSQKRYFL